MRENPINWKLLSFFILSLFLFSCQSNLDDALPNEPKSSLNATVTIAQAKQVAIMFLNQGGGNAARGLPNFNEGSITEVQTIENDNGIPIMYALNLGENSGFVVMSATLLERPILAYGHEGKFDLASKVPPMLVVKNE